MRYLKLDKHQKKEASKSKMEKAMHGEGLYVYQNNSSGTLDLPRKTKSGKKTIAANEKFQGDNYYFQLVKTGHLKLVQEIISPTQERQAVLKENILNEEKAMEQNKLILDQPNTFTNQGQVEQVEVRKEQKPLNEIQKEVEDKVDVLLNESPVSDGFVIVRD